MNKITRTQIQNINNETIVTYVWEQSKTTEVIEGNDNTRKAL